ncbi:MAG: hypothetical protein M3376_00100 [Actinomycetota bacterium]|nr:hypothetical protein [Actinomycetota bacterium]
MTEEICGGAGCNCLARKDGFCSDHCKEHVGHGDQEEHECHCGHADCAAEAGAAA